VYGFQFLAIGAWTAYAIVYFEELGLPLAVIGVLAAVPAAVAIAAAPAWGLLADRLGDMRGPYLAAGLLAAGSGTVIALGLGAGPVVVGVLGLSIGAAGTSPLVDARTIQRLWPRRERYGQARVAGSIAFAVGSIVTGLVVARAGTAAMFAVYALGMAAAGVAAVLLLGRPRPGTGERRVASVGPVAALRLLREPGLGLFFAGSCVTWTAAVGAMTLFSLRILELGGDAALVGVGWAVTALFEAPLMVLFPRLAGRTGVERLIVAGALLFVIRAVVWSLAGSPEALIALTALGGMGYALVLVGTTAYVARVAPPQLAATAQALFGLTTFSIGSIAGAVLAGQVAAVGGLWAVYPTGAAVSVAGAAMLWAALRQVGDPAADRRARARRAETRG
jgi:PPP family 3-phenylpropionic acid transporter